jgi:hypothetical protein
MDNEKKLDSAIRTLKLVETISNEAIKAERTRPLIHAAKHDYALRWTRDAADALRSIAEIVEGGDYKALSTLISRLKET